jgi:hypothetical protein
VKKDMTKKDFNEFRFEGLDFKPASNKYWTMKRVNADETKIVVNVGSHHLQKTKYGYALILDEKHVVFIKDWQVNQNYFGNEVIIIKKYFNVKEWGQWESFGDEPENLEWAEWLRVAKLQQDAETVVKWEK